MTMRLLLNYGLVVHKQTVRELLKILDPDGVAARLKLGYREGNTQQKVQITCGISIDMTS